MRKGRISIGTETFDGYGFMGQIHHLWNGRMGMRSQKSDSACGLEMSARSCGQFDSTPNRYSSGIVHSSSAQQYDPISDRQSS